MFRIQKNIKNLVNPWPRPGFAGQEHMTPSRIFYDYSNRLYGSRARAGLLIRHTSGGLILSKKLPPQAVKFIV